MPIYTGRGDEGNTDLRDMSRVSKTDPRIEAYGTVDELNALLGTVLPTDHDDLTTYLTTIQNHLFIIQAEFANPAPDDDDPTITTTHIDTLESWIDDTETELEPLQRFILPGGGPLGAQLHHARAVARRAERRAIALASQEPLDTNAIVYLNRLSDALFVFARLANRRDNEPEDHPTY
jgi:cob(I)alamin adenosyltransferase